MLNKSLFVVLKRAKGFTSKIPGCYEQLRLLKPHFNTEKSDLFVSLWLVVPKLYFSQAFSFESSTDVRSQWLQAPTSPRITSWPSITDPKHQLLERFELYLESLLTFIQIVKAQGPPLLLWGLARQSSAYYFFYLMYSTYANVKMVWLHLKKGGSHHAGLAKSNYRKYLRCFYPKMNIICAIGAPILHFTGDLQAV